MSGLLGEIDHYKQKLQELKQHIKCESGQAKKIEEKKKTETETDRHKLLFNSHFPFSRRMYSMFEVLEIHTVGQLAEIPLEQFACFRGFKKQSKKELIAYIEFENIERLFGNFSVWKKEPME